MRGGWIPRQAPLERGKAQHEVVKFEGKPTKGSTFEERLRIRLLPVKVRDNRSKSVVHTNVYFRHRDTTDSPT